MFDSIHCPYATLNPSGGTEDQPQRQLAQYEKFSHSFNLLTIDGDSLSF